jgi:hypothetical protein
VIRFGISRRAGQSQAEARKGVVPTPEGSAPPPVSDLARAFLLAEHTALRAELVSIHTSAQSTIQWTLATFSAVFGAGLISIAAVTGTQGAATDLLFGAVLLFGYALPAVIWSGALSWIGAMTRAERIGGYLRGFEQRISAIDSFSSDFGFPILNWETFISSATESKLWRKSAAPFIGVAALFFGCATLSVATSVVAWSIANRNYDPKLSSLIPWGASVLHIGLAAWSMRSGNVVLKMGRQPAMVITSKLSTSFTQQEEPRT